jgi:N-acetylmuramoyl-L-alanine amidase
MKIALLGLAALGLHATVSAAAPLKVTIDPGHGGKDHGAVQDKIKESDLTLEVARRLLVRLNGDRRFQAALTRTGDEFLALGTRVDRARAQNPDIVLSIHVNWSTDKRAHGLEVYFQNQLPPDEESMFLAARENQGENAQDFSQKGAKLAEGLSPEVQLIVQDLMRNQKIASSSRLAKSLRRSWLGENKSKSLSVKQAPFFVISNLPVPSALVEIGFLSHPREGAKLLAADYQETIAQGLHEGLAEYLQESK